MTKESVKKFFKDHKEEIIEGTVMTIGGTILAIIGVNGIKKIYKPYRSKAIVCSIL